MGITGSAGKTTTKELLGAMLATRFRTAWTPGNLNNLYGFPLSLLNVPDGTEWMVAEMGMSTPGELRQLSLLGRPDAAVFTVVRPVHLEFFGSVQAIAEAKSELLAGLAPDGFIVANADDPEVTRIARRHGARVVWYGIQSEAADVRGRDLAPEPDGGWAAASRLEAGGESQRGAPAPPRPLQRGELPGRGGLRLGARPLARRRSRRRCATCGRPPCAASSTAPPGGFTLVDDSYNSNPDAVGKALESAAAPARGEPAGGRAGRHAGAGARGAALPPRGGGSAAARLGFSPVAAVGRAVARAGRRAPRRRAPRRVWLPDAAAAAEWAAGEVRAGDVVLVKGSRGVGLDSVVRRLLGTRRAEGAH